MKNFVKGFVCGVLFFFGAGTLYIALDDSDLFRNHPDKKKKDSLDVDDLDEDFEWLDDLDEDDDTDDVDKNSSDQN